MLVWTFIPCLTAAASTYGLNEEPTCSRFWSAMFHSQAIFAQKLVLMTWPVPLYLFPM